MTRLASALTKDLDLKTAVPHCSHCGSTEAFVIIGNRQELSPPDQINGLGFVTLKKVGKELLWVAFVFFFGIAIGRLS